MITLLKLNPYTGDQMAPSPNHDARVAPEIEGIVLHATADAGDEATSLSWMRSATSRVSCHLLVSRAGRVTRLVGDRERAWHAGQSWWRGTSDVNSITLGIEIANRNDGEPFTDAQYHSIADIVAHYCGQGLSLDDVVSHEQIAEGRKTDPLGWNWDHFRAMVKDRLRLTNDRLVIPVVRSPMSSDLVAAAPVPAPRAAVLPKRAPVKGMPKPILHSRTLWLNALMVLGAGSFLAGDMFDLVRKVGIHLPEPLTKWVLFIFGLVNILLRLRTTQPLTCTPDGHCSPPKAPPQVRTDQRVLLTTVKQPRTPPSAWRQGGKETFGWRP